MNTAAKPRRRLGVVACLMVALVCTTAAEPGAERPYANERDAALEPPLAGAGGGLAQRRDCVPGDCRPLCASANLESKRALYPAPKVLHAWGDQPRPGHEIREAGLWSHEIDSGAGDLASVQSKIDYVRALGADVLYLNPVDKAYTNHKYDTQDYFQVSEEYGTRDDLTSAGRVVASGRNEAGARRRLQSHGAQRRPGSRTR